MSQYLINKAKQGNERKKNKYLNFKLADNFKSNGRAN